MDLGARSHLSALRIVLHDTPDRLLAALVFCSNSRHAIPSYSTVHSHKYSPLRVHKAIHDEYKS